MADGTEELNISPEVDGIDDIERKAKEVVDDAERNFLGFKKGNPGREKLLKVLYAAFLTIGLGFGGYRVANDLGKINEEKQAESATQRQEEEAMRREAKEIAALSIPEKTFEKTVLVDIAGPVSSWSVNSIYIKNKREKVPVVVQKFDPARRMIGLPYDYLEIETRVVNNGSMFIVTDQRIQESSRPNVGVILFDKSKNKGAPFNQDTNYLPVNFFAVHTLGELDTSGELPQGKRDLLVVEISHVDKWLELAQRGETDVRVNINYPVIKTAEPNGENSYMLDPRTTALNYQLVPGGAPSR